MIIPVHQKINNKKKTKGERDWFGRILLILDTLWDLFTSK